MTAYIYKSLRSQGAMAREECRPRRACIVAAPNRSPVGCPWPARALQFRNSGGRDSWGHCYAEQRVCSILTTDWLGWAWLAIFTIHYWLSVLFYVLVSALWYRLSSFQLCRL